MATRIELSLLDPEHLEYFLNENPHLRGLLPASTVQVPPAVDGANPEEEQAAAVQRVIQEFLDPNNNLLIYSPLSFFWRPARIRANPTLLPALYICGMAGYACSLPIRVVIFAITFFRWVLAPLFILLSSRSRDLGPEMKKRTLVMLGALGEVGTGVLGVVCPPLGYRLDEAIQSNSSIHEWYKAYYLSVWSREFVAMQRAGQGNEERVEIKRTTVQNDIALFRDSVQALEDKYLDEGASLYPAGLTLTLRFGVLKLMIATAEGRLDEYDQERLDQRVRETPFAQSPLAKYWSMALDACPADLKDTLHANMLRGANRFSQLREDRLLEGVEAALIIGMDDDSVLKEGQGEELRTRLAQLEGEEILVDGQTINSRAAVEEMALIIRDFSENLRRDRELETLLLRGAQPSPSASSDEP